jgi:hypothetical protein
MPNLKLMAMTTDRTFTERRNEAMEKLLLAERMMPFSLEVFRADVQRYVDAVVEVSNYKQNTKCLALGRHCSGPPSGNNDGICEKCTREA